MVIWIMGPPYSGKTALAREMHQLLCTRSGSWSCLDGTARDEQRRKQACDVLAASGANVLLCVRTATAQERAANRQRYRTWYRELVLAVPPQVLEQRGGGAEWEQYTPAEVQDALVVDNSASHADLTELTLQVLRELEIPLDHSYFYSREDRLRSPHRYEYTPYEGMLLLDAWQRTRAEALQDLEQGLVRMQDLLPQDRGECPPVLVQAYGALAPVLVSMAQSAEIRDGVAGTAPLLAGVLQRKLEGTATPGDVVLTGQLAKKFEVFKRLYAHYYIDTMRKADDDCRNMMVYLLFANVLAQYVLAEREFGPATIRFNTLLKLNDTIVSVARCLAGPVETALACHALRYEEQIYRRYSEEVGL